MKYIVSIFVNAFLATGIAAAACEYGSQDNILWILLSIALIWFNIHQLQRSERQAKQRFNRVRRVS